LSFLKKGSKFDETSMLAVTVSGLLALATLSMAGAAVFATPSPNGPGQPQVECGEDGVGEGPHGFSTSGFENAESKYAGSDGTPSAEHANSDKAVSQYDVACLQTTGK
jgi:hypothetical protein